MFAAPARSAALAALWTLQAAAPLATLPLAPVAGAAALPIVSIAAAIPAAADAAAEVRVRDDSGVELRLPAPASRIVSLSPHLTELLFAAGAGERIVGVVEYSDYPPAARRIEQVGSSRALDLERIARLRPDLVVAWRSGNGERALAALRALRIPVYENEPHRLEQIGDTLETLGRLAGTVDVARGEARKLRARLAELRRRYAGRSPVTVFHQVWAAPLLTVNREHVIDDVIALCGGRNVFADLPALTPSISVEAVVRANPEVISTAAATDEEARTLDAWRRWPSLAAAARGNFVTIHPDHLHRHAPRIVEGVVRMCEALETARSRRPR